MPKCLLNPAVALSSLLVVGCTPEMMVQEPEDSVQDVNNNGFIDITPPDGIDFDATNNVNIAMINTVSVDDLEPLAEQMGVDPALLPLATINVQFLFTLNYGSAVDVIEDTRSLEPFEERFEVACPQSAELSVVVDVFAPFVGPVTQVNVIMTDVDLDCGQIVTVTAFVTDDGEVDHTIDIQ